MNPFYQTKNYPSFLIRFAVGIIFFSEGIQKFLFPETLGSGRFEQLGFARPVFWANLTGTIEIICSDFILVGLFTRVAAIPLLIIMVLAFVKTKYPELRDKGFWIMAHDYRTDFAMTILLIYLLIFGGGQHSLDKQLMESKNYQKK
jgi:uncharacterized membrane protein YphA (DoxX/SURF4 family)